MNTLISSIKYWRADPLQRFFYDLQSSKAPETLLKQKYSTNGSLEIDHFILDLERGFTQGAYLKLNCVAISHLSLPREKEIQIYELGIKILIKHDISILKPYLGEHELYLVDNVFHKSIDSCSPENLQKLLDGDIRLCMYILQIINIIPQTETTSVFFNILHELMKDTSEYCRDRVYSVLFLEERELRADLILDVSVLLKKIDSKEEMNLIFAYLGGVHHKLREDLVQKIESCIERSDLQITKSCKGVYYIVKIAHYCSETHENLNEAICFLDGIFDKTRDLDHLFSIFSMFPNAQRTVEIFRNIYSLGGLEELHDALDLIPSKQRVEIFNAAYPSLLSISESNEKAAILIALMWIPKQDRTLQLINAIPHLFKGIDKQEDIKRMLNHFPEEKRKDIILKAVPYIMDVNNIYLCEGILYAISLPDSEIIFEHLPPPYYNLGTEAKQFLQIFLALIPVEERKRFPIKTLCAFLKRYLETLEIVVFDILRVLSLLPVGSRKLNGIIILTKVLISLAKKTMPFNSASFLREQIETLFFVLSPTIWDSVMNLPDMEEKFLSSKPGIELVSKLFENAAIRDPSHLHLKHTLEEDLHPDTKWKLVNLILANHIVLYLHEDHEIVQLAIAAASICSPDARTSPNNPYNVHQEIVHATATEDLVSVDLKSELICERNVRWNLQKLQEKGAIEVYVVKDLPPEVKRDTLNNLFVNMQHRLGLLNKDKLKETHKYIEASFGESLEALRRNVLDKPFLQGLLMIMGNQNMSISPTTFQFFAVLKFILDANENVTPGQFLSEREEILLRFSASVQNCSTGQRDGLANFYNLLPNKSKKGFIAQECAESRVEKFVNQCIQKTLHITFTNSKFLKAAGSSFGQQSHSTEYLKNRYHKQLGLHHRLIFDSHTGMLSDRLFKNPTKNVISQFFDYCTPYEAVKQVVIESRDYLKKGEFVSLTTMIERFTGKIEGHDSYQKYCLFDAESLEPLQLTEKGALALLLACGYMQYMQTS